MRDYGGTCFKNKLLLDLLLNKSKMNKLLLDLLLPNNVPVTKFC